VKDLAHLIAASWNVNGIRTKNVVVEGMSQLTMVVRAILPDILFLQETHYTAGGEHKNYIEGMTVFHSSIPRGRTRSGKPIELSTYQQGRRAGLATALKNSLDPNRIATKLDETQALRGYLLPLRIQTARGCILVLNTYLPPDDTHRELIMGLIGSWIGNNRKRGEPMYC
jgi:exonuclease III